MEFTTNIRPDGTFLINVVQCRPLHVQSDCAVTALPDDIPPEDILLRARDAILGRSRVCTVDRVIYVMPEVYGRLPLPDRYAVARLVGRLCRMDSTPAETGETSRQSRVPEERPEDEDVKRKILLLGPGRWGTSMPSLGVPVTFHEISGIAVLGEIVAMHDNLVPDVSLGTHLFNELVEADILYFALFPGRETNSLNTALLDSAPNRLEHLVPESAVWSNAVKVIDTAEFSPGRRMILNANTPKQEVVCYRDAHRTGN